MGRQDFRKVKLNDPTSKQFLLKEHSELDLQQRSSARRMDRSEESFHFDEM